MNNVFQKRTNIVDFSKRKNIVMNFDGVKEGVYVQFTPSPWLGLGVNCCLVLLSGYVGKVWLQPICLRSLPLQSRLLWVGISPPRRILRVRSP